MYRNNSTTGNGKKKALIWIIVLALAAGFIGETVRIRAEAEDMTAAGWVICQPGDYVNARRKASTRSESLGRLEAGYPLRLTGKTKNGFAQVTGLSLEETEGWVYAGYIVFDEPVWIGKTMTIRANGRVAARKCADGERRCWVTDGSTVTVYWMAGEWSVTSKGFIRTEYIGE